MQSLPLKKIAIGAVAIIFVALGVFYVTNSKGTKATVTYVNPAFGEYISSFTSGVVGSGSTIRIILSQDVADSTSVGQEVSTKLFSLSPSVSGKTVWLDRRTLEFRPANRLVSGQMYEVSFALARLLDVPKELAAFEYSFQVILRCGFCLF